MRGVRLGTVLVAVALSVLAGTQPWRRDSKQWGQADVDRVLAESPWSQAAAATFPDTRNQPAQSVYDLPGAAQAGLPAPKNAATDGRWDGGIGRNTSGGTLPTIPVLVRWDSSLPIRQALLRSKELGIAVAPADLKSASQEPKSYVLSIIGLIPANQYKQNGTLPKGSSSDSNDGTRPVLDTEQVLEGLMANTLLYIRGRQALRPENVRIDPETGTVHVFFSRSPEITRANKEVALSMRFGSLSLEKRFRLSDMVYQDRLEL